MMGLSIVVPIFNEQENVLDLHKEIKEVCIKNKYNYEIIFIDDGSTDNTGMICKSLSPLKYIRLRKNFGQTAAFDAGIKKSKQCARLLMSIPFKESDGFNMMGLGKHVHGSYLREPVPPRRDQAEIAGQSCRIAGDVDNLLRRELRQER